MDRNPGGKQRPVSTIIPTYHKMRSQISQILAAYKTALTASRDKYEGEYSSRGENALEFYQKYASRLVRTYGEWFLDAGYRRRLHRQIADFVGSEIVDFVAIDGSCNKDPFNDFIVFSACAYGAKGQLELGDSESRPALRYRRWQLDRDVSMVAYVPVPLAQLAEATGSRETFLVSDQDRVNLSAVHNKLMQLAEVYLAYSVATASSLERPRLILMDLLPSSALASVAASPASVHLGGYHHDRRRLDYKDIVTALARPVSTRLRLPNRNRFRLHQYVLGELANLGAHTLDLRAAAARAGVDVADLRSAVSGPPLFGDLGRWAETATGMRDSAGNVIARAQRLGILVGDSFSTDFDTGGAPVRFDVRESWEFTKGLFRSICERLFRRKEPNAMIYEGLDGGGKIRERWLDPGDIDFLIGVGLRALVEACWEQRVLLVGIAKDSASRYLTRNYLGVLNYALGTPDLAAADPRQLPWTDRMFFEFIANLEENLAAPWSTYEFDSAFMTLWVSESDEPPPSYELGAVQGHIVAHTGLFARSLAQFFLSRAKATPLMGHVVFVDRLLDERLDAEAPSIPLSNDDLAGRDFRPHGLGNLSPIGYQDAAQPNHGQDISMYLLSSLTRNHYPEVIGYPDPLHKADWGAKTLSDKLRATIRSSQAVFRARPLAKTLRAIRDSHRR